MTIGQSQYLHELANELGSHPEKEFILAEYEDHLAEVCTDLEDSPSYVMLVDRMGEPKHVAKAWKDESSVTQTKLQWLFIFCNVFLFVGGSLLTLSYHLLEWSVIEWLWRTFTSLPMLIVLAYFGFWSLLGYEMGKAFGAGGRRLLRRTFFIGILPNLLLMTLTVTKVIPHKWFDPLITKDFILICVISTVLLYPVCWFGFRWGKRMSV